MISDTDWLYRWESEGGKTVEEGGKAVWPEQEQKQSQSQSQSQSQAQISGQSQGMESGTTAVALGPARNELLQALDKVPLSQAVESTKYITNWPNRDYLGAELIKVAPTDTLAHVLQLLSRHRIACVPVVEPGVEATETETESKPGQFVGFVDVLDIAVFLAHWTQHKLPVSTSGAPITDEQALKTQVGSMIDASHKDAAHPLEKDQPCSEALEWFAKGVHRVPMFKDQRGEKTIVGICSQYDLVCTMSEQFELGKAVGMGSRNIQHYKDYMQGTPWGSDRVVSVAPNVTLRQALLKMAQSGLTALAIVESGAFVGRVSAAELSLLGMEGPNAMSAWLDKPLEEFIQQHRDSIPQPIFELPTLTLAEACKRMTDEHAHHIWIVDSLQTMRPQGVVSLTDVCRIVRDFKWPSWLPTLSTPGGSA